MVEALVVLAILDLIGGLFNLTQATLGVGAISSACLFGIFARLAQSQRQHRQLMALIREHAGIPESLGPVRMPNAGRWECANCQTWTSDLYYECARCGSPRP